MDDFRKISIILSILGVGVLSMDSGGVLAAPQQPFGGNNDDTSATTQPPSDTTSELPYPLSTEDENPFTSEQDHPFDLGKPEGIERSLELDSAAENYNIQREIGGEPIGDEERMSIREYREQQGKEAEQEYFQQRSKEQNFARDQGLLPEVDLGENLIDQILSGGIIDIQPRGSAELTFKGEFNRVENPAFDLRQQRTGQFKFDQNINLNVNGTIADRINLGINYNTESQFQFDNEVKLNYQGEPDEIVQGIELGNINMPVPGTLIDGAQSLFGIKTELQFGRLTMTTVLSQKRSEKKTLNIKGGAQRKRFDKEVTDYDENRHFFLAHYFRENFNEAMEELPNVNSQAKIERVEIWVTNQQGERRSTRNVLGFADLGEPDPYNAKVGNFIRGTQQEFPGNNANSLYQELTSRDCYRDRQDASRCLRQINDPEFRNGQDYLQLSNARKLDNSDYTLYPRLGFISLNKNLNDDESLAVAFEYTINGERYQVGEFSRSESSDPQDPKVLFLKLLKSTSPLINRPIWDLMMKNIYSIGGFQISRENFRFQVIYEDDASGGDLNYLPVQKEPELTEKPLIQALNLDQLNRQQEGRPDGLFDFIPRRTILPQNGRVIFPLVEPFGTALRERFKNPNGEKANQYAFDALYDSTQFIAEQQQAKNKFVLQGRYQSSSGQSISLNAINIPKNSVKVTSGGVELQEGTDYTVDYTLGRVKILNEELLSSGQNIQVSAESNQVFSSQRKTFIGNRFDYKVSDNFNLGGTFLYQRETPITQKTNIGNEPVANIKWGLDGSYKTESRFLTDLVDGIPLIDTKEPSSIALQGEYANLIPGQPSNLGSQGVSYLDDFEGTESSIDLRVVRDWTISSTPAKQPNLIENGNKVNNLSYNDQRAKIAWYQIDRLFYRNNRFTPDHIARDRQMQSNHYMRRVDITEVFRNRQNPTGVPTNLNTFDIAFFPKRRGPYNYNAEAVKENGKLKNPEDKWGGIMRAMDQPDFQQNNIQYVEFWMMDPFKYRNNADGGDLYLNLGSISEDIMKDGATFYENGMPENGDLGEEVEETAWGYVPVSSPINFAFSNDPSTRPNQDIGLDGLTDERERERFDSVFIDRLRQKYGPESEAVQQAEEDPSADNYRFYRSDFHDRNEHSIIRRYLNYNNTQGNSPTPEQWPNDYSNSAALKPDVEDINNDFTLNKVENYYQYKIDLEPEQLRVGQNYIANAHTVSVDLANEQQEDITWYQFRIPIRSYDKKVGNIQGFNSIRFMRMFFTDFSDSVICRFGQMNLVRSDWRRYREDPKKLGPSQAVDPIDSAAFDIATVNIEENGQRRPIPYVLPPGIQREVRFNTSQLLQQNEQSLTLEFKKLEDNSSRAAIKRTSYNVRRYKNLEMYAHAEGQALRDGDVWLFVRLGTDFKQNYYEYAIPLEVTSPGTTDPRQIWPEANELNFRLKELIDAKLARDKANHPLLTPFTVDAEEGRGEVTVLGRPDLNDVQSVMIGVWNRNSNNDDRPSDNGRALTGEVWVNELRVSDFDDQGGWAARGQINTKFADFAEMTLSGNRRSIGFGGLSASLQERSQEKIRGFDFKSSLNLGKFFPEESGVKVPMYYTHSEKVATPRYNPLNRDVLLDTRLELATSEAERDSIKRRVQDFQKQRSLSFTNVRKARTGQGNQNTSMLDIENFSATYEYREQFKRNVRRAYDKERIYRGLLNYNYSFQTDPVRPFRRIGNADILKPIRDFNFNYLPSSIGFRTELRRRYNEFKYRSNTAADVIQKPNYSKSFTMDRVYNLRWDLTQSLKLNYSATMTAAIDEPFGEVDQEARDSIRQNLLNGGRPRRFQQRVGLTYDVPLRKFPFLDWTSLQTSYDGSYRWDAAAQAQRSRGNTINNSQDLQFNGQLQMRRLYNKVEFFKTINRGGDNVERIKKKRLDQLIQEWKAVKQMPDTSAGEKPTMEQVEVNEGLINTAETVSRGLMSLRNVNINYNVSRGSGLNGFLPSPDYFGQDFGLGAPTTPFLFGGQTDIQQRSIDEGWLTRDPDLNRPYTQNVQRNLRGQALVEPIDGMRINVSFSRRRSRNTSRTFRYFPDRGVFDTANPPRTSGSYSTSFFSLPTAFIGERSNGISPVFQQFEANRRTIAERLSQSGVIDPETQFPKGYAGTSQEVLIPAFIAAYSGQDASDVGLSPFPDFPAPNWRLTYNGLSELELIEDAVSNISLSHSYQSTYSVNNFSTELRYNPNATVNNLENGENFNPEFEIPQITINESLSPLIGIDITWENDWTTRLEFGKTRQLSFRTTNNRLTEVVSNTFTIGAGYRTQEFVVPFRIDGERVVLDNELNFRFDFRIRDNKTTIRRLDKPTPEPVSGQTSIEVKPNVNYQINDNLRLRVFFNRSINEPATTNSFPRRNTNFGFSLRYTLGGRGGGLGGGGNRGGGGL